MFDGLFGPKPHPSVPKPNYHALAKRYRFTERELKKVFRRFGTLCGDDGFVREQALCYLEDFILNPLLMWFVSFEIAQSPKMGLDFEALVRILSVMSPMEDAGVKIGYLLRTLREALAKQPRITSSSSDSNNATGGGGDVADSAANTVSSDNTSIKVNANPPTTDADFPIDNPEADSFSSSAISDQPVSRELFVDLFSHLNSGLAPKDDVKQLAVNIWSSVILDVGDLTPKADRLIAVLVSQYDLWSLLTAEIVF